jgi:hypothetical protein
MSYALVVEAGSTLAGAYSALLAPAGFSCRAAQTGEQAIRAPTRWIAGGLTYD